MRDATFGVLSNIKDFFTSQDLLIRQNLTLTEEITSLQLKVTDYGTLVKENQDLKNSMNRIETIPRILSRVLSKPPRSPYDTLVIDAGSADSVVLGDKVFISDTILIGSVTDVTSHTSLVTLFSTPDQKTTLEDSRTSASFEVIGAGGANLKLIVPKETDILWGDIFLYPGLTSATVGTVYYIDTTTQGSFKTVYLRIPANIFATKWVFVEK